jgi:GntR family transcriptional repressor for pyruvate dehydrogenase complex
MASKRDGDDPATGTTLEWAPTAAGGGTGTRTRAADHVFVQLAGAILRGQLAANQPLPPERDLATRFDISRVLVREAIHRLKDLGLVRVKQGGQTTVLDPDDATDPRVMALALELAPPDGTAARDLLERHLAHSVTLLELAEHRMVLGEVQSLEKLVADYAAKGAPFGPAFATEYWTAVARSTKNKILYRETRWWMDIARSPTLERALVPFDHPTTLAIYEGTTQRLRRREGASAFFLEAVRPALHAPR